jgi:soluble lytic murein transglycosylase-like protein
VALLAVVGVLATAWVMAVKAPSVTPVASAAPGLASAAPHRAAAVRFAACPFPNAVRGMFERAAADANLPPAMLYAVAKVESNLSENAQSAAGARGLLQVLPSTARSLDLDVDEPATNVLAGARYLRQLIDRFDSLDLALAAYNAGPTAVEKAGGAPSQAVLSYVANVNRQWLAVAGCR